VREVNIPVLFIMTRTGPWDGVGEVQKLYDAAPGPKEIWWIDGPPGRMETYEALCDHPERVLAFAAQYR
jgi:hypothetical protein